MKNLFTTKKWCWIWCVALLFSGEKLYAQYKEAQFTIKGDLTMVKKPVKKVAYFYKYNGKDVTDSAIVKDSKYELKGMIDEPQMVQLDAFYVDAANKTNYQNDYATVHLVPGTIANIKHEETFAINAVTGSAAHDEFQQALAKLRKGNTSFIPQYLKDNPNSAIAYVLLQNYFGPFIDPAIAEPIYNSLSTANQQSHTGRAFFATINAIKNTQIGNKAPNFEVNKADGEKVKLSDFKGKYLLVEFWASWCLPCREENPNLVAAYNTYRSRGFEILGISHDVSRKNWLAAIEKDNLSWTNTSDLKMPDQSDVAKAFGVNALPTNFLLDPNGVIIAKNLRGKALVDKLAELLKKN